MMIECPCCGREYEPDAKDLTQVAVSVRIKIAPGDSVMRSAVADIVQNAVLEWMHEDTWNTLEPTDELVDVIDVVVAR